MGTFIIKNRNFITDFYFIPDMLNYQKEFPELYNKEKNLSEKVIKEFGDAKVNYWENTYDPERQNNNIQTLVNRNKYLFNDSKTSLVWLKFNDEYFLESLVKTFGYMRDRDLLKWVADKTLSKTENNGQDYNSLFFIKDCSHKFVFHKETFEILKEHINKTYLKTLLYYFSNKKDNQELQSLTFEQKAQVLAYIMYIGEYFVEDDKYMDYRYRFMGPFYEHSGEGDKYDEEFKKKNYYNLPKFKELWEQAKEEGDGIGLPM